MNCYAGLAKRIVKSCFPQVVPVPQLEPLDASKIIKQEACIALSDVSQSKLVNQQTYWTHERLFNPKPITDEEVWAATLAWAEAKAQEREAEAVKACSHTETDESYVSDDYEVGVQTQPVGKIGILLFGDDAEDEDLIGDEDASGSEDDEEEYNPPLAAMAGLMRRGTILEEKKAWNISDAAATAAMWRDDAQAATEEAVAVSKAIEALDKRFSSPKKYTAAIIIQAAARGMLGRYGAYTWLVSYYKVVMKIAEEGIVAWEAVGWAVAEWKKTVARETSDKTAAEEVVETTLQIAERAISEAYTAKNNVVWAVAMAVSRRRTALGEARVAETVVGALAAAAEGAEAREAAKVAEVMVASARRLRVEAWAVVRAATAVREEAWAAVREEAWAAEEAATIIQAAERGRAVRAYNAFASANKKPNMAVHFTAFNHPLPLSKALPIDIYDQDAWYRAALRAQPAAPLYRLIRPRRLEQSSVRNWATLHFNNLFIIH